MKKKLIALITALTLCAAVVVGGTLAYFSTKSDEVVNTFTYDNSGHVIIDVEEPEWPEDLDFTPGMVLPKDPKIIVREGESQYFVAMTIHGGVVDATHKYANKVDNLEKILNTANVAKILNWNTTDFTFEKDGNGSIYAYHTNRLSKDTTQEHPVGTKLKSETAPVFTSVQMGTKEDLEKLMEFDTQTGKVTTAFPDFKITVQGYAVSTVNDTEILPGHTVGDPSTYYADFADCKAAMKTAFKSVFDVPGMTSFTPNP